MTVWHVDKFGGIAVGQYLSQLPLIVKSRLENGNKVGLICSARSQLPHHINGTTSRLLSLIKPTLCLDSDVITKTIDIIIEEHINQATLHILNPIILTKTKSLITDQSNNIKFLFSALAVIDEISSKTLDLIVSVGERLAYILVLGVMESNGFNCLGLELDRLLDHVNKDKLDFKEIISQFELKLNQIDKNIDVIIMPGFMGPYPMGLMSSIGRGYSDVTASLLSIALSANELTVWKHIDGLYSSPPELIPSAKLLNLVDPIEAKELTYYGSDTIHPQAIDLCSLYQIPIRLTNIKTKNYVGGTIIISNDNDNTDYDNNNNNIDDNSLATAVALKKDIIVINCHSKEKSKNHFFLRNLFQLLNQFEIITDLIATSQVHVSMAIPQPDQLKLNNLVKELERFCKVNVIFDVVIISLVGKRMSQRPGVAKAFFNCLSSSGANLDMISQGSSEISISGVISKNTAPQALQAIQTHLLSNNPMSPPMKPI